MYEWTTQLETKIENEMEAITAGLKASEKKVLSRISEMTAEQFNFMQNVIDFAIWFMKVESEFEQL